MKKYLKVLYYLILVLTVPSCKKVSNFLDKAPSVDVTENVIFSSRAQLDFFITSMYKYGVYPVAAYRDASLSTTRTVGVAYVPFGSTASDEGEASINFSQSQPWNAGSVTSADIVNNEDLRYFIRWISVRQCNIILERINEVPDADDAYKKQVTGEAKFIRALDYMEMLKRYGGVPIVSKRFTVGEEVKVPRSSVEDVVKFIVADCDDAIAAGLPLAQPSALRGRATSLAVLALKAKALLYAASPLFNATTPYLSMPDPANNKLICYGSEDNNRWKLAADAAKAAMDAVDGSGGVYRLLEDTAKRDPKFLNPNKALAYTSGFGYPLAPGNYKESWEIPNNPEVIFAEMGNGLERVYLWPGAQNYPAALGNTSYNYGVGVTHNFVRQYEVKTTGLPETWPGGSDLQAKYDELDPRFKQTVAFSGNYHSPAVPIVSTFATTNGDASKFGANFDASGCPSAMWLKKYVPDALYNGGAGAYMTWPLFRVNELYLNFAEAYNEANNGPGAYTVPSKDAFGKLILSTASSPVTAYDAVNRIRLRSGMPPLPQGLSKEQFRDRVRHERMIELAFDDQRFWDVRRWKIADQDGIMRGAMYGQKINRLTTGGYSYSIYAYETRLFYNYEYLDAFDLTEVRKGNLVQNPGW